MGLVLHWADYCLIGWGIILDQAYAVWVAFQELRGSAAFYIQLSYYSPTSIAHSRAGPINHHCPCGNVNTMDITFSLLSLLAGDPLRVSGVVLLRPTIRYYPGVAPLVLWGEGGLKMVIWCKVALEMVWRERRGEGGGEPTGDKGLGKMVCKRHRIMSFCALQLVKGHSRSPFSPNGRHQRSVLDACGPQQEARRLHEREGITTLSLVSRCVAALREDLGGRTRDVVVDTTLAIVIR